jgi:hypothetical protein
MTLNLLRHSRINPQLSAYTQLHGTFNFNKTPLAPPGTRVIIHEKSGVWRTWAPHGVDGWYLGPPTEHYRCYTVFCTKTGHERIADTVEFFPSTIDMPRMMSTDAATVAANELTHALLNPAPSAPFATIGDAQLAEIFQLATNKPQKPVANPATNATGSPPRVDPLPTPASRDNQPHVIPNDNGIPSLQLQPSHNRLPPNTPHLIPQDNEQTPRVPQYQHPHKYNTRAAAARFQCFPNLANAVIDESSGQTY